MVTSPTEKGVVVIGGTTGHTAHNTENGNALHELAGDSLASLKWRTLKQKLQYSRHFHVSFPIPGKVIPKLYFDGQYCPFNRRQ